MNDQDLAGLPEDVREAIRRADAGFDHTGLFDEPAWQTIRAKLLRLARENAGLQQSLDRLHGARFSDRAYAALKDRAERAEAELAALKRRIAEAPKMNVTGSATNTYIDGSLSNWVGQRVALLPVGGENER